MEQEIEKLLREYKIRKDNLHIENRIAIAVHETKLKAYMDFEDNLELLKKKYTTSSVDK